MRILLIATAYNGLTQRTHLELTALGHEVSLEFALSAEILREGVGLFRPDLIICPFLKDRIPDDIWENRTCIIIHPGIKGDRGTSSMDWAMMEGVEEWGVTALQATDVMDAGDIWASATFKRRPVNKARMYRHEVTEAGMQVIRDTITRFTSGIYFPEALDYTDPDTKGKLRLPMTQKDRAIDWQRDHVDAIIRKVYSADNQPGVLDTLFGEQYYLYGAHREGKLLGNPSQVIAWRQDAICIAAVNGAVWISHLRKKASPPEKHFKLPATRVLADALRDIPERPLDTLYKGGAKESFFDAICLGLDNTYNEIWYHEENDVGYLAFDFYNGAMDTGKCHRLREAFLAARQRPTRVIVLSCGMDFWSNGIHLHVIEAAQDPAKEAWENINAIDDLIHAIITTDTQLVISAMLGNAAAGGLILALAADEIYARHGIVLNPHYKTMGLYGSEYWTYLLSRRTGWEQALRLTEDCLPIDTERAYDLLLIDGIIYSDGYDFYRHVARLAEHLAHVPDYDIRLQLKAEQRRLDERKRPLAAYREQELAEMKKCFFDRGHVYPQCGVDFHTARRNFVHNIRPAATPERLARHRKREGA
uniref:Putative two-component system protein, hydrogenase maturation factor HypX/HoxX n=1 Tax=Candidatus Kentrum sp. FM TaxID=2126340 RepID=A0A450TW84_9GAMM|nr:MAG: putative two-component system protein, hydrogenase maturation factor HypX/HoxX [Candidatus Kentron sp. FM]VFJ73205.1 MAG: putative two-component system protein, hydrogenase maturation factor HypX/HoxX [Candidatus Kentron sp. FM]VFK19268.1 MAG: putative two-component system protein, hydrogenase maturation factor HypX/HoxX [Candidatus Kentron sp. FM]